MPQNVRVFPVSKRLLRQCVIVAAIMGGVAVIPAAIISLYVGYYMLVPRYSAVVEFDKFGFNLRLDLFLSDDEGRDSGRYLSVINGGSYHTVMIPGWDWSHHARTSIYRIDDNHLAVLSALGYDGKITLKPFGIGPVVSDRGDGWQYLGAFDFLFPPNGRPRLQFFDSRLAECIPMGMAEPSSWADKPRAAARHANCPSPPPELGVP
jgi:hypothetical protein